MTLDIEKMKAAAMADTEDELQWSSTGILELITRLEAAESELNVCSIEYGDVRDSYLHYKEKYEEAEKDAARFRTVFGSMRNMRVDQITEEMIDAVKEVGKYD